MADSGADERVAVLLVPSGERVECRVPRGATVGALKAQLAVELPARPPVARIRIIHSGRVHDDAVALAELRRLAQVPDEAPLTVHVLVRADDTATPPVPQQPVPQQPQQHHQQAWMQPPMQFVLPQFAAPFAPPFGVPPMPQQPQQPQPNNGDVSALLPMILQLQQQQLFHLAQLQQLQQQQQQQQQQQSPPQQPAAAGAPAQAQPAFNVAPPPPPPPFQLQFNGQPVQFQPGPPQPQPQQWQQFPAQQQPPPPPQQQQQQPPPQHPAQPAVRPLSELLSRALRIGLLLFLFFGDGSLRTLVFIVLGVFVALFAMSGRLQVRFAGAPGAPQPAAAGAPQPAAAAPGAMPPMPGAPAAGAPGAPPGAAPAPLPGNALARFGRVLFEFFASFLPNYRPRHMRHN